MTYDFESDYAVRGKLSAGKQAEQAGDAVLLGSNGKIPDRFISGSDFKYSLSFDAATFATDPTACLAYADDAVGFTKVDGSAETTLKKHANGSWGDDNPLINSMFYATFNGGTIHHILDPEDLTKDINGVDRSSEIQTDNVMLVIPTVYSKRDANGISISSKPSQGTPYAHTYDGHTYKYLAIGVYEGTIVDGKLKSVSGTAEPSHDTTRANFRAAAQANGDGWMLTNWHTRQLIRDLTLMVTKSFDSQRHVGQGFSTGGSNSAGHRALVPGLGNKLGRYAGNPSGTSDVVKCLIENPWASKWEFIDDVVTGYNDTEQAWTDIYAGQKLQATDDLAHMELIGTVVTTNKAGSTNTFATAIQTDNEAGWGIWDNTSGADNTGLCDKHWSNPSAQRLCICSGSSSDGSADGVSTLNLIRALSDAVWAFGARPAFVFD